MNEKILITGGNGFIGTNLVEAFRQAKASAEYTVIIVDIAAPKIPLLPNEIWSNTDIMDLAALNKVFATYMPDVVIHLAALTDCDPKLVMADYIVNTQGSTHIFDMVQQYQVSFLMHTSTQFVHQGEGLPVSDTDYAPHTVYGESKIVSENILRSAAYTFNWVIIRPTNIWGPWHLRYPHEFWKVLRDGKYFHPGTKKVTRSYGFVSNICFQMIALVQKRNEPAVSRQVFYVGDAPLLLFDWANKFSLAITGKKARVVPSAMVYMLALFGSGLQKIGVGFPITLSRYKSMTSDNPAPMEKTFEVLGPTKYSLDEGVQITAKWLTGFWQKNA